MVRFPEWISSPITVDCPLNQLLLTIINPTCTNHINRVLRHLRAWELSMHKIKRPLIRPFTTIPLELSFYLMLNPSRWVACALPFCSFSSHARLQYFAPLCVCGLVRVVFVLYCIPLAKSNEACMRTHIPFPPTYSNLLLEFAAYCDTPTVPHTPISFFLQKFSFFFHFSLFLHVQQNAMAGRDPKTPIDRLFYGCSPSL